MRDALDPSPSAGREPATALPYRPRTRFWALENSCIYSSRIYHEYITCCFVLHCVPRLQGCEPFDPLARERRTATGESDSCRLSHMGAEEKTCVTPDSQPTI